MVVFIMFIYTCLNLLSTVYCGQHGDVLRVLVLHTQEGAVLHDDLVTPVLEFHLLNVWRHTLPVEPRCTTSPGAVLQDQ